MFASSEERGDIEYVSPPKVVSEERVIPGAVRFGFRTYCAVYVISAFAVVSRIWPLFKTVVPPLLLHPVKKYWESGVTEGIYTG